jgi:hypothetical protein
MGASCSTGRADSRSWWVRYHTVGRSFIAEAPRPWSPQTLAETGVVPNFDVSPSGDAILALMPATEPQTANHVTVVLNFGDEIRRRAETP